MLEIKGRIIAHVVDSPIYLTTIELEPGVYAHIPCYMPNGVYNELDKLYFSRILDFSWNWDQR